MSCDTNVNGKLFSFRRSPSKKSEATGVGCPTYFFKPSVRRHRRIYEVCTTAVAAIDAIATITI